MPLKKCPLIIIQNKQKIKQKHANLSWKKIIEKKTQQKK